MQKNVPLPFPEEWIEQPALIPEDRLGVDISKMMKLMWRQEMMGDLKVGKGVPVTEPTRVFRVEMPNGNGPFNDLDHGNIVGHVIAAPVKGFACTLLANENGEKMGVTEQEFYDAHGHANYGCDSVESLNRWFQLPAREFIAAYGGRIVEYEIPVGGYMAKTGNGEVIFNRHAAKRIGDLPLVEDMAQAA